MQKFLRNLMLTVAMLLPFASQAQTMYLTVADSTATNSYVPVYGLYVDDFVRCQTVYPADMLTSMTGENILGLTYYLGTPATSSWGVAQFVVNVKEVTGTTLSAFEDMTGATTVYTGSLDATQATMEIEFDIPYAYQGGNLLIEIYNTLEGTYKSAYFYGKNVTGASWQGNNGTSVANITGSARAFMPKTTFVYGTAPTCFKVQNLTASDITSSSITLSWDDTINSGATYTIYDMSDTTVVNVTIVDNTAIIDELDANTVYTFGVQTDCGAGDIANGYTVVSTRTSCEVEELPFIEDFSASLATDPCWRGASGTTAAEAMAGTALTFTTNQWTYESSTSNGLEAGHYRVNIYGASCKKWMITPTIDFSTASSPLLSFDAAFTAFSGTGVATGFENNATQLFMILASTDNGQTWDSVANISLASIASTSYLRQYVDLSEYAGDTVRIAFYAQSTVSGGDNNLHIDNISIDELDGDLCLPVTGLDVDDVTTDGATLIWNGTAAGNYTIIDMADSSFVATVTDTTYDLTGLTAMTQYAYGVVANCSSSNSDTMVVVFNTACVAVELPYTEDFEETSAALGCWTVEDIASSTGLVTTGAYSGTRAFKFGYNTNPPQYLISPELSGADNGVIVSFMYKAGSATYPESFQLGYSTTTDDVEDFTWGTEQTNIVNLTYEQYIEYLPAGTKYVAFKYTANDQLSLYIDSVVFAPMSGSFCFPVADLAVDSVTATSVFLSWSDNNNTGATYSVYGSNGAVIATNVAGTSYEVTGLTALTGYTFGVAANCSAEDASDIATIDVVTGCAGTTCEINVYAEDAWGDGWNDAILEMKQNGFIVANYTMASQSQSSTRIYDTASITVCASAPVELQWFSGQYDDEIAFTIADYNGDSLYAVDSASNLIDGATFFATATPCGEVSGEVTITFAVNDATMGTTTPAPGTYTYEEGETISLSATAYEGYRLSGWHIEIPMLSVDTTVAADFPAYTDTVSFVMNGSTFTAIFAVDVPEATIAASDILYWVGEGSNQAVLAINWPDTALAWGYRFNGTATVQDMIEDIAEADPRFSYTIENGYLSDFTFVCENGETLTGANAGYWESKNNGISDAGMAQTLSNGDFEKWANSAAGVVVDSIYYEGWGWSYIYNYPMTIHPVSVPQGEIVTITFTVNDASMGTITPSGVQTYHVGETLTVTATPYAGYQLVAWQLTIDGETQTVTEDITTTYTDAVIPEVDGAIITAVFQRETGIDDVEAGDFKAYSIDSRIVVKGVENMNVNIYDVTGRVVYNEAKAAETIEFTVPSAGVYMVKAGNAPAKRVVVVR